MIHRAALLLLLALAPSSFAWAAARESVVRFPCGREVCEGTLYLPDGDGPFPIVVMGHGFAGTRDVALPLFARRIADAGVAALAFDYRHFGTSGGTPRQYIHPDEQIEDFASAVAAMRKRKDVDGTRLALWGTSMGAGHALVVAARDGRVKALVMQAPLIDTSMEGEATWQGAWFAIKLVFSGWRDLLSRKMGYEGYAIPSIGKAASFAIIADYSAYAAFEALVRPDTTYRNQVLASSVFNFKRYNPITHATGLSMPVLVVASRTDRFAPFAAAEKLRAQVKEMVIETFEGDHFNIYSPPAATAAAAVEAEFLADMLKR